MHLSGLDSFLWATIFVGEVLTFVVLVVRRRARSFPLFTVLIAEETLTTFVKYVVFAHFSFRVYQYFYWSAGILDEVLQLLVFYEIASHVFCPTGAWARDVRKAFLALIGASAVAAFLLTWLAQPETSRAIHTLILRSNFFSAVLMSELLVGMMVLSGTVGLPWRTHVARIAQGLGTYSILCVGLDIMVNFIDFNRQIDASRLLDHVRKVAWIACESYWVAMLWVEAPAPRELPAAMRTQIYILQRQVEGDLIRIRDWRKN